MNDHVSSAPEADAASTGIAEYTATEHGLAELRSRLAKRVYDVTTTKGLADARSDRAELRSLRVNLDKLRKQLNADDQERINARNGKAKEITEQITALESPIDEQIKQEEARKEEVRAQKERDEAERLRQINSEIDRLRNAPLLCLGTSAETIAEVIDELASTTLEDFDEVHLPTAQAARDESLERLRAMLSERAELDAQRAELDRLQAEAAERRREADQQREADAAAARERLEAEEEEARQRRAQEKAEDAERAQQAEADRIERERVKAEQDERQRQLDEEARQRQEKAEQDERERQERLQAEQAAQAEQERQERERQAEEQRERWASRVILSSNAMTAGELDALCQLLMSSDPWPTQDAHRVVLSDWADDEAQRHGFTGWIDAYHGLHYLSNKEPTA